ncbi:tetratricopeptide repeat protein [Helicobacter pylori]|uniref:tetratricopeptide repeat protein n=1 Tax=Helicobacter pylori TaxID=210 RepID=UPI001C130ECF|nr:tetratricopeptide repeat protein [Helicobacter pylori]
MAEIDPGYAKDLVNRGKESYDKQNFKKAFRLYKKACDLNNGRGCSELGMLYWSEKGVKRDKDNYIKAFQFFSKACDLQYAEGCTRLGISYYNGEGVELDYIKAIQYYKKACDLNNGWGCAALGEAYERFMGSWNENNLGRYEFSPSLFVVDIPGRVRVDSLVKPSELQQQIFQLYKKACDLNNGWGCRNLSFLYEKGHGVEEDQEKAAQYHKKACDLNSYVGVCGPIFRGR